MEVSIIEPCSFSNFTTDLVLAEHTFSAKNGTDTRTIPSIFRLVMSCTERDETGPKHSIVTCRFQTSVYIYIYNRRPYPEHGGTLIHLAFKRHATPVFRTLQYEPFTH